METALDDLLCPFNYPGKHRRPSLLKEVIRIVLDVAITLNDSVKGNNQQPPPRARVIGTHPRQMVGIKDKGVARRKMERVFILLLSLDCIRGTKLFDEGGIEPHTLVKFCRNQHTLALGLGQFRLHVTLAANGQRVR